MRCATALFGVTLTLFTGCGSDGSGTGDGGGGAGGGSGEVDGFGGGGGNGGGDFALGDFAMPAADTLDANRDRLLATRLAYSPRIPARNRTGSTAPRSPASAICGALDPSGAPCSSR